MLWINKPPLAFGMTTTTTTIGGLATIPFHTSFSHTHTHCGGGGGGEEGRGEPCLLCLLLECDFFFTFIWHSTQIYPLSGG
jgi:hypothetical protein